MCLTLPILLFWLLQATNAVCAELNSGFTDQELTDLSRHHDVIIMSRNEHTNEFDYCPPKCQCYTEGLVNCSRLGLSSVPTLPKSVVSIDLSSNKIQHLEAGCFKDLPYLTSVDLGQNLLNETSFTNKSFEGTVKLQTLYLYENQFTTLPRYLPKQIKNLYIFSNQIVNMSLVPLAEYNITSLRLDSNAIHEVPGHLHKYAPDLVELDLSFNLINDSGIPNTSFKDLTKLETLQFRFNKMNQVPMNLPRSLLHFDMVGNPIESIKPYNFENLTKLQTLEIWNSGLKNLPDYSFYGLESLTILDLMDCHVESPLTNYTLTGLTSVKTIDLSLSKIRSVEVGAFHGLTKLQELWLFENPLKSLSSGVFSHEFVPSIREIYLDGDQWVCDCNLKWLKLMQENGTIIQDPHLMLCDEPVELKGKTWDEISSSDFTC